MKKKAKILVSLFIVMIAIVFILKCSGNKVNTAYSYYTDLQEVDSVGSPAIYKKAKTDFINSAYNLSKKDFEKLKSKIEKYKEEKALLIKAREERKKNINELLR
jgi:hypothetical protein